MNQPFDARRWLFVLTATTALCSVPLLPALAQAQRQQAGVTGAVRGDVTLAAFNSAANVVGRQVRSGEAIFLGDKIRSGPNAGMQVMLLDETVFTIGPDSEIAIDEFVYDPNTGQGKVAASVTKGVFRFVTGKVAQAKPESMEIRMPTAVIGVRGTFGFGEVGADGRGFAGLGGPGPGNNSGERRGGIDVTTPLGTVAINRQGFGTLLIPGQPPQVIRLPPELVARVFSALGSAPAPAGGGGGPGGTAAGGGSASNQAGQGTASGLTAALVAEVTAVVAKQATDTSKEAAQAQQTTAQSTFEDLRGVGSGSFHYFKSSAALDNGGTFTFALNIDFSSRTVGGGNSFVGLASGGSFQASGTQSLSTLSFASGAGLASFAYALDNESFTGASCGTGCNGSFTVKPQNVGGTAGEAIGTLIVKNTANTAIVNSGSAKAARFSGPASGS